MISNSLVGFVDPLTCNCSLLIFLSDNVLHSVDAVIIVFKIGMKYVNLLRETVQFLIMVICNVLQPDDLGVVLMVDLFLISNQTL